MDWLGKGFQEFVEGVTGSSSEDNAPEEKKEVEADHSSSQYVYLEPIEGLDRLDFGSPASAVSWHLLRAAWHAAWEAAFHSFEVDDASASRHQTRFVTQCRLLEYHLAVGLNGNKQAAALLTTSLQKIARTASRYACSSCSGPFNMWGAHTAFQECDAHTEHLRLHASLMDFPKGAVDAALEVIMAAAWYAAHTRSGDREEVETDLTKLEEETLKLGESLLSLKALSEEIEGSMSPLAALWLPSEGTKFGALNLREFEGIPRELLGKGASGLCISSLPQAAALTFEIKDAPATVIVIVTGADCLESGSAAALKRAGWKAWPWLLCSKVLGDTVAAAAWARHITHPEWVTFPGLDAPGVQEAGEPKLADNLEACRNHCRCECKGGFVLRETHAHFLVPKGEKLMDAMFPQEGCTVQLAPEQYAVVPATFKGHAVLGMVAVPLCEPIADALDTMSPGGLPEEKDGPEIELDDSCSVLWEFGPVAVLAQGSESPKAGHLKLVVRNPQAPSQGVVLVEAPPVATAALCKSASSVVQNLCGQADKDWFPALVADSQLRAELADPAEKAVEEAKQANEANSECPICMEQIESEDAAMRCAGLGGQHHYFHGHCLRSWARSCASGGADAKCPLCRGPLQLHANRLQSYLDGDKLTDEERPFFDRLMAAGAGAVTGEEGWSDNLNPEDVEYASAAGLGFIAGFLEDPWLMFAVSSGPSTQGQMTARNIGMAVGLGVRIAAMAAIALAETM